MISYRSTMRHPVARCLALLFPIVAVGGCCCPSFWYDTQAFETWAELERSVNDTPPPGTKMKEDGPTIEEQTGVTMHLPLLFAYRGQSGLKPMTTLVPGTFVDGNPVAVERVQPYLVKDEKAVLIGIPGQRFAYEMLRDGNLFYCYLAALPKGKKAYDAARSDILDAVKIVDSEVQWETKDIEGAGSVDYLELTCPQGFSGPKGFQAQQLPGKLVIYMLQKKHANIVVAYRGPADYAEEVGLFKAGEAALATIKSVEPAKPITTSPGGSSATPDTDPQQAKANLRQIGVAMMSYHSAKQRFPGGTHAQKQVKFSWQVQLLPHIEQAELDQRIRTQFANTSWDSPPAQALLSEMPAVYLSSSGDSKGPTRFRVFSGPGTLFPNQQGMSMREIRDGTSGTLLAIEVGPDKASPWIQPGGIPIDSPNLLAELGAPREQGYFALLADGSVVTLRKDISEKTLRALISPAGSEGLNRSDYLAE